MSPGTCTTRSIHAVRTLVLTLLLLGVAAASARAEVIKATFNSVSPGDSVRFTLNGGAAESTTAGEFNWTRVSGANLDTTFKTFCVDLTHFISYGGKYTYDLHNPLSSDKQAIPGGLNQDKVEKLSELFGKYYSAIHHNETAAGFQIAVWDIVYDGGVPTSQSPFQVISTGPAETDALIWLNHLEKTKKANLVVLDSNPWGSGQDQITPAPAPEPSAWILACIGGVGLLALAWRRRARAA